MHTVNQRIQTTLGEILSDCGDSEASCMGGFEVMNDGENVVVH